MKKEITLEEIDERMRKVEELVKEGDFIGSLTDEEYETYKNETINKNLMKQIMKMVNKENSVTIRYVPTESEIEFLKEKGIEVKVVDVWTVGIISNGYIVHMFQYTKKEEVL